MQEAVIREIQQLRLLMGSSRDPRGRVFAQLADALRRSGELDEAWQIVRDGLEADPHFAPGHLVKGWVLQDRGDLDAALAAYRRAVDLDPDNPFGLFGAGSLLRARGDREGDAMLERARELHDHVESFAPESPEALVPLHELPFLSLAELAPGGEGGPATAEVGAPEADLDLPFMSLADLAPDAPALHADELPFMALEALAPDPSFPVETDVPEEDVDAGESPHAEALADAEDSEEQVPWPDSASAGGAVSESEAVSESDTGDATPATRTMAELLVSQNRLEKAVAIYEDILERDPGNEDIAARIRELREDLHPELSGVGHQAESGPSPFTWHDDDDPDASGGDAVADEVVADSTAADYFGDLLSFSPGRGEASHGLGDPEDEWAHDTDDGEDQGLGGGDARPGEAGGGAGSSP